MKSILAEQRIYKRGSHKIARVIKVKERGRVRTKLLLLLVIIVGLLLLTSALAYSRIMRDLHSEQLLQIRNRNRLENMYFRQLLDTGSPPPEASWQNYRAD